jgi:hypothetical protein
VIWRAERTTGLLGFGLLLLAMLLVWWQLVQLETSLHAQLVGAATCPAGYYHEGDVDGRLICLPSAWIALESTAVPAEALAIAGAVLVLAMTVARVIRSAPPTLLFALTLMVVAPLALEATWLASNVRTFDVMGPDPPTPHKTAASLFAILGGALFAAGLLATVVMGIRRRRTQV